MDDLKLCDISPKITSHKAVQMYTLLLIFIGTRFYVLFYRFRLYEQSINKQKKSMYNRQRIFSGSATSII